MSYGNGGNVGNQLKPIYNTCFALTIESVGKAFGVINTDGIFSVYSETMGEYLSGDVNGSATYMVI